MNPYSRAPYGSFEEFISPGADRFALLCAVLEENRLSPRILELAGKRHIALNRGENLGPGQPVVLTAHYDRAADSPGANDNSAAVFMLIEAAMDLYGPDPGTVSPGGNPLFIFTDKEELSGDEGLEEQGAYSLALYLREQGIGSSKVFCFDACGVGDTLIISTAADHLLKNEQSLGAAAVRRRVRELRSSALEAAREARIEKVLLLPTPFSDDAGFLRAGVSAQTITVLPEPEATAFVSLARTKPEIIPALVSRSAPQPDKRLIPETWRTLNGPEDSPLRLTAEYWKNVVQFVKTLCRL
jgi:hypothetical protein